jgi:hypothetical protein
VAVKRAPANASIEVHGQLSLTVVGPDGGIRDRRDGENIVCTVGYTQIAAALVWSGIQDQAANLGITAPTFLTPLYGAVGSGSGTVAKADTQLFTELGRQPVGAAGSTPASVSVAAAATWLFYFPNPAVTWTVTEAGVFAAATSVTNAGSLMDHWSFSPTVTVTTTESLILQLSLTFGP